MIEPPKSTIGVRKIQPKKAGQKRGGMGATKVKTNFAELEQRANLASQFNESVTSDKKLTAEEEADVVQSVRLAYQDLSLKAQKEEEKLKVTNPNKARQMERLGMGFANASRNANSHSVMSDMQTISQETSSKYVTAKPSYADRDTDRDRDFFDDYSTSMYSNGRKDDMLEMASALGFETIEPIKSTPTARNMFSSTTDSRSSVNGKYENGSSFKRNGFY